MDLDTSTSAARTHGISNKNIDFIHRHQQQDHIDIRNKKHRHQRHEHIELSNKNHQRQTSASTSATNTSTLTRTRRHQQQEHIDISNKNTSSTKGAHRAVNECPSTFCPWDGTLMETSNGICRARRCSVLDSCISLFFGPAHTCLT